MEGKLTGCTDIMALLYCAGADTERYMDVFKSSGGTWYVYESNYKHHLASIKEPPIYERLLDISFLLRNAVL